MAHEQRRSKRQKTCHNYAVDLPSSPARGIEYDPASAPIPMPMLDEPEYDPSDDPVSLLEQPEHGQNEDCALSRPEEDELPENDQGNDIHELLSALPDQFQAIGKTFAKFGQHAMVQLKNQQLGLNGHSQVASPRDQVIASNNEASLLEELNTIKARLAEREQELDTLKTSRTESKEDTDQVREGSKQSEEDLTSLQSEIKQKDKQLRRQQKELDQQRKQLMDIGLERLQQQNPLTRTQGPDVGSILSAYKSLYYAIRNFATDSFKGEPFRKPNKKQQKMAFQKLVEDQNEYEDYLTDRKYKSCLIEAVIWDHLIEELLQAPLAAYHGSANMEKRTRTCLQENIKDYPSWRAGTGELLHRHMQGCHDIWKETGQERVGLVDHLINLLLRFHVTGSEDDLKRPVDTIVEKAVDLACLMSRSRAFWVVTMNAVTRTPTVHDYNVSRRFGYQVNEEHTKVVRLIRTGEGSDEQVNQSKVSLVVRPLVLKWGDSSGWHYDTCTVMEHREVIATES